VIFFPKGSTDYSAYTQNMKKCAIETFKDTLEIAEKKGDSIIHQYRSLHTPVKVWKGQSKNFVVYMFLNANRLDIIEMSLKPNVSAISIPSSQEDSRMYSNLRTTAYQLSCITYELLFVRTYDESTVRENAEKEIISIMPKNSQEARLYVLNAIKNTREDVKRKTILIDFINDMYTNIDTFLELNENKNYTNNKCKTSVLDFLNNFNPELHVMKSHRSSPIAMSRARSPSRSSPIAMSRARSPSTLSSVSSKPKKYALIVKKQLKKLVSENLVIVQHVQ
jgi:hypothetical protein